MLILNKISNSPSKIGSIIFLQILQFLIILPQTIQGHGGLAAARRRNDDLVYAVEEETTPGTIVGHVIRDSGLSDSYPASVLRTFKFKFLNDAPTNLEIDENTGVIRTSGRIDREALCKNAQTCPVRLDIAIQPMNYFQIIKATVDIMDVNDNSPEFPAKFIRVEMMEAPMPLSGEGASVSISGAVDKDSGMFSVLEYELTSMDERRIHSSIHSAFSERDMFELVVRKKLNGTPDLKLVQKKELDRETMDVHYLKLIAYDGGGPNFAPKRSGSVDITVVVLDANDNSPQFEASTYEATLPENVAPHTTIVTVKALDRDTGPNADVRYDFSETTKHQHGHVFAINNLTGEIYVTGSVDYETSPIYQLMVIGRDLGHNPLSAEAMVVIRVDDVNDNPPALTFNTLLAANTKVATVPEDALISAFVAYLIVKDPDSGRNGRANCSIVDSPEASIFRLQRVTTSSESAAEYQILTNSALDREMHDSWNLRLICQDSGLPSLTAVETLRVDIGDVNDNSPKFIQSVYTEDLLENNYIGVGVVQVNATDMDWGDNSVILYSLASEQFRQYFEIDPRTGWITARTSLDHESNSILKTNVYAVDQGKPQRTGTAQVTVRIQDVNDEKPIFVASAYSFGIEENRPAGYEVGIVTAVDADGHPYNKHFYSFLPTGSLTDAFSIERSTGRIVTTRPLDRETRETYSLVAVATDDLSHGLTGTAIVSVLVMDVNDQTPSFLNPPSGENGTVTISGKSRRGAFVFLVKAIDGDAPGENSQIEFSMDSFPVHGSPHSPGRDAAGLFWIDPTLGQISLSSDIMDFSGDNLSISLQIRASDRGHPPLHASTFLTVIIDKTMPLPPPQGRQGNIFGVDSPLSKYVTFIAILCSACGIVLILLCIAIVCVARRCPFTARQGKRPVAATDNKVHMDEMTKNFTTVLPTKDCYNENWSDHCRPSSPDVCGIDCTTNLDKAMVDGRCKTSRIDKVSFTRLKPVGSPTPILRTFSSGSGGSKGTMDGVKCNGNSVGYLPPATSADGAACPLLAGVSSSDEAPSVTRVDLNGKNCIGNSISAHNHVDLLQNSRSKSPDAGVVIRLDARQEPGSFSDGSRTPTEHLGGPPDSRTRGPGKDVWVAKNNVYSREPQSISSAAPLLNTSVTGSQSRQPSSRGRDGGIRATSTSRCMTLPHPSSSPSPHVHFAQGTFSPTNTPCLPAHMAGATTQPVRRQGPSIGPRASTLTRRLLSSQGMPASEIGGRRDQYCAHLPPEAVHCGPMGHNPLPGTYHGTMPSNYGRGNGMPSSNSLTMSRGPMGPVSPGYNPGLDMPSGEPSLAMLENRKRSPNYVFPHDRDSFV